MQSLEDAKQQNYMKSFRLQSKNQKIEMIRQTSGEYRLDHAVTATQKAIRKHFRWMRHMYRKKQQKYGKP